MCRPKNETEVLLLSISKNCEKLTQRTHRKAKQTLKLTLSRSREKFLFNPPIMVEGSWMLGLTNLEVYQPIFNVTEENSKLELYTSKSDEFSFEELKEELDEFLSISDVTPSQIQHEITSHRIIQAYKKLRSQKSCTDGYIMLLLGYTRSKFPDFESYHRIVAGLDEDDFQFILKQCISFLITYELSPRIFTIKDISQAVHTKSDHEGTLQIQYDDISMKAKPILTRCGSIFER